MAQRTLPGGNLHFTAAGEAGTPDASLKLARNREALDRDIRADADNARGVAEALQTRVRAVETVGGLAPGDISDAQVASHLSQPDSQTSAAMGQILTDRVTERVEEPLNELRTELTTRYAPVGSAVNALAPHQVAGPDGDFYAPTMVAETELLRDTEARIVDGAKFFVPVHVGRHPGTWMDEWYGYLAGHDSPTIWLVTAPDLLGPWTWREPVVGIVGSGARMTDAAYTHHTSSPEAFVRDGVIHLYYHGPLAANNQEQPTTLATSTDGINFSNQGIVLQTEFADGSSPYRTSVSYVSIARHGGLYHAIWQGTTGYNSSVDGYAYAPMPVGYATSVDGRNWIKRPPLLPSGSKDQGLFAPGLVRVAGGWMVIGSYRSFNGTTGQNSEAAVFFGETLENLRRVGTFVLPGDRSQVINSPKFVPHNGRLYMVCGARMPGQTQPVIIAAELEWR